VLTHEQQVALPLTFAMEVNSIIMQAIYATYPLDDEKEEIRLLTVFPENWDRNMKCSFSIASLTRHPVPAYAALSYVWGDPTATAEVNIEDQVFHVSHNLHHALRRLRWHGYHAGNQPLTMWADAICINQTDPKEKAHQVQLMRKIYSKCKHVLVWLGEIPGAMPEDKMTSPTSISGNQYLGINSPYPFSVVSQKLSGHLDSPPILPRQSIIPTACAQILTQISEGKHMTAIEPFNDDNQDAFFRGVYRAFKYLRYNAWFTRRWVIQEAVLAPSVGIFFGEISMDIEIMSRAMDMIATHTDHRCCLSSRPGHYNLRHAIRGFLQKFIPICNFRNLRDRNTHIIDLCVEFVDRKASLQADCVYSLLGMTNPPSAIIPDYTLAPCKLFTGVCSDYINDKSSLSCLPWAGIDHRVRGLPSWVINWSALDTYLCKIWTIIVNLFKPSQQVSKMPQVVSYTTLHMMACEIDQVDGTSDEFELMESRSGTLIALQNFGMQLMAHVPLDSQYPSGGSWREAWWRTLSADSCWGANSARRLTRNDVLFFSSRILGAKGTGDLDSDSCQNRHRSNASFELDDGKCVPSDAHFNDILGMINAVLSGMVLFYTKKGYIGIAKQTVRPGDVVILAPDCQMPMIMRHTIQAWQRLLITVIDDNDDIIAISDYYRD
jgi:hypothetical protein